MKKVFGTEKGKVFTGLDVDKALQQSNPGVFREAVEEVYRAGGGTVYVGKKPKKSEGPERQDEVKIDDVREDDNFLTSIHKKYKNGLYLLRVIYKNHKIHSEHHFVLGGMEAKKAGKKKGKKGKSVSNGFSMKEFRKLAKVMQDGKKDSISTVEMMQLQQKNMEIQMQQQQKSMEIQSQQHQASLERQMQMFQMMMSSGGSSTEEALAILQVAQQIQPHVEKEEPMMQLLTGISPIIGEIIRAKSGGGQQINLAQIEAEVRQRLTAAAAPGAAPEHAPPPGASSSAGDLGGQTAPVPAPVFAAATPEYFDNRFVKPFQRDVADDQPAIELAYQIIAMVTYATDRMQDNPPLLVADFLKAESVGEYIAALDKFFGAIPELSSLTARQNEIKAELMKMFAGGPPSQEEDFIGVAADEAFEEVAAAAAEQEENPIIHMNEDQAVEQEEAQDVADNTVVGETETSPGTEQQDSGDHRGDNTDIEAEAIQS